jgi:hypothetical protein
MAETAPAPVFKKADSTLLGTALITTGKGVQFVGDVAGVIPFGIGSAAEAGLGLAGIGMQYAGDQNNNDPLAHHNAAKRTTEVGAKAALDVLPGGGLLNLGGRVFTEGWKAPTDVISENVANSLLGKPEEIAGKSGLPSDAPLGTPGQKKPQKIT